MSGLKKINLKILLSAVVISVVFGSVALAAITHITIEAESGNLSGSVSSISDPTAAASGGRYLAFTTPASPGSWVNIDPAGLDYKFSDPNNFGLHAIAGAPSNPDIIYLGTSYRGVWRTDNGGTTWRKLATQLSGSSNNCDNLANGRNWTLAVDPVNPDVVYTTAGYGCRQGVWKSTDGGNSWVNGVPDSILAQATGDISIIVIDPWDHNHVIVGTHSTWSNGHLGYIESNDGGATWSLKQTDFMGDALRVISFLGNSSTMIIGSQDAGIYRTTNRGSTWTKVPSAGNVQHGSSDVLRTASGKYYLGSASSIIRSTDEGATWTKVKDSWCSDGYLSIASDGTNLYTAVANTGGTTCGASYYETATEANDSSWQRYNSQSFGNGPVGMVVNPQQRTIVSANWLTGLWRMQY